MLCAGLAVLVGFATDSLRAEDANTGIPDPSIATSLPQNGDPGGIRKHLAASGFTYTFIYTNDVLSNLSGGTRRSTIDQGKLEKVSSPSISRSSSG